jgi:NAD(P)-dependent dehydrogenase (short-subunit alcohol dehydrogenase family)
MTRYLKGKSAIVTGGGEGGIGEAVALSLATEGAMVLVNDIARDPDGKSAADKVVEKIRNSNGKAVANYDSVVTVSGGENIIKTAISNFGRVDILVNCAGNIKRVPAIEMTEDDWDSVIDVHLKGHFNCTRAAITEMVKQRGGRIINFSSRAASGGGGSVSYSSAKAGILGFTLALASELKEYSITVNAIVPSADTKLFPGPRPKFDSGERLPSSLWISPDYVASIVIYLATDNAQDITGRIFYASGGDICIYSTPLTIPGGMPMFVRKMGKWTVDELDEVIPPLLGKG